MASNVSPGPSPYIGWKWSKPQTPSKPSSSASFTRRTTSSHGIRWGVTSSPKRISVLCVQVPHEEVRPGGEVGGYVIAALVVDRLPVLGDVLDGGIGRHVALGLGDEHAGEAAEAGGVDLARDRAVLVGQEGGHRGHQVGRHPRWLVAAAGHAGEGAWRDQVDLDAVIGARGRQAARQSDDGSFGGRVGRV